MVQHSHGRKRPAAKAKKQLPREPNLLQNTSSRSQHLRNYFRHHHTCCMTSLKNLRLSALAHTLTLLAIGIALALPTLLYLVVSNAEKLVGSWDSEAHISVFLNPHVDEWQARDLADYLLDRTDVASVQVITKEQALTEFDMVAGFNGLISELPENPLPHVLIVKPLINLSSAELQELQLALERLKQADSVQYDLDWIQRLFAYLQLGQRLSGLSTLLLGAGVLVVVGNTIRLLIQNQQKEIEIVKLIGATDGFVRRPFLYTGFWLGFIGSLFACLIVGLTIACLMPKVNHLADLYNSHFHLQGLDWQTALSLVLIGSSLSVFGSWLVVRQHLKRLEAI